MSVFQKIHKYSLSIQTFLLTGILLSFVQLKVSNPMLLLERFIPSGGWVEIIFLSLYAAFIANKMKDPKNVIQWRKYTWLLFSIVFFSQLIIGLCGYEKFLMTGELHLPIPAIILGGAIYKLKIGFMPILLLSTILLSGPAWCSHLCYFGAFDNFAASGRGKNGNKGIRNKFKIKYTLLILVIAVAILLRAFDVDILYATLSGALFGIVGLFIIIFISSKKKKMVHCVTYCPIGTLVMYLKYISPFRVYIDDSCTNCMKCTGYCKYDALNITEIKNRKPGKTCTYCGDCMTACQFSSIKYKLFNLSPERSRNIYLLITITLHAVFIGLARI